MDTRRLVRTVAKVQTRDDGGLDSRSSSAGGSKHQLQDKF